MNAARNTPVVSPIALGGFAASVLAIALATVGCFGPYPFGAIRIPLKVLSESTALLVYGTTFILPIVLGLLGAATGGYAFQSIERSEGRIKGNGLAFFSVLIGIFAAIVSGIATFAVLIYPVAFPVGASMPR